MSRVLSVRNCRGVLRRQALYARLSKIAVALAAAALTIAAACTAFVVVAVAATSCMCSVAALRYGGIGTGWCG